MSTQKVTLSKVEEWAAFVGATQVPNLHAYEYARYAVDNADGTTVFVSCTGDDKREDSAAAIAAGTAEVNLHISGQLVESIVGFTTEALDLGFDPGAVSYEPLRVARVHIDTPIAADEDGSELGEVASASDEVTAVDVSSITQPDVPRNVVINPCDLGTVADIAAGDITVTGTDVAGNVVSEAIAVVENQAHDTTSDGAVAFATITGISIPAQDGADASFYFGYGDVLGLPFARKHVAVIAAYLDDTLEATAPTVVSNATDVSKNTVELDSSLDGNDVDVVVAV